MSVVKFMKPKPNPESKLERLWDKEALILDNIREYTEALKKCRDEIHAELFKDV